MIGWLVPELGRVEWREDLAEPIVGAGEVLVEVIAAAPNFADRLVIDGTYQERIAPPFTPGIEVVGRVADRTVVGLTIPTRHGAWAERAAARPGHLCDVPAGIHPVDALAVHTNAQTAWFALHRRAAVRAGEVVLVHAAAGGVGSMALQLAVAHDCEVVATSSAAKREVCLGLGARHWFDNRDPAWRTGVQAAVGAVDVVVDPVGGSVFDESVRALAFEGRIVTVGFASGERPTLAVNRALVRNISLHGVYWTRYLTEDPAAVAAAAAEIFDHLAAGRIDPLITRRATFAEAADCVAAVAAGSTSGKTILTW